MSGLFPFLLERSKYLILELFGKNVERLRKKKGLSQKELGARVGKAHSGIWSVEVGKVGTRLNQVEAFKYALDTDYFHLFGTEEEVALWEGVLLMKELYSLEGYLNELLELKESRGDVLDSGRLTYLLQTISLFKDLKSGALEGVVKETLGNVERKKK